MPHTPIRKHKSNLQRQANNIFSPDALFKKPEKIEDEHHSFFFFFYPLVLASFLEQRLLALEARYGKELQGLESEKEQLQQLVERQSRTVSQLQAEVGSSVHNSTVMQRQQAVLMDTVQQLLAMVNNCKGETCSVSIYKAQNDRLTVFKPIRTNIFI